MNSYSHNSLVRYARQLSRGRFLKPDRAAVQAAADTFLEGLLVEELPGESDGRLATLIQLTYATQNQLELRERPSRWKLAAEFFKFAMPRAAALAVLPAAYILITQKMSPALLGDIYDQLMFLPYFMSAGADYGTTIRAFKKVDVIELNPFFQKIGYDRLSQAAGWGVTIAGALILPTAGLLEATALRLWVAYNNHKIPAAAVNATTRRIARQKKRTTETVVTEKEILVPQPDMQPVV